MRFFNILFIVLILFSSCGSGGRNKIDPESLPPHHVRAEYEDGDDLMIIVTIESRLSISEINRLGNYLSGDGKKETSTGRKTRYNSVSIYYEYTDPEGKIEYKNKDYAASYRDYYSMKEVRSKIFDPIEESDQKDKYEYLTRPVDGSVVGKWYDRNFSVLYIIYIRDGVYYLENRFPDNSVLVDRLEVKMRNGRKTYNVIGDNYEFFYIGNDGLYIYDMYGELGLKVDIF